MTALLAFCGATILIAMVPGPSTVVVIRERIQHGRGPAMAALAGNETGILFWGLAAAFGLSTLVAVSEVAYDTIRIAGVVVLVCLGVQALRRARRMRRETVAPTESKELPARSAWAAYRTGVVTCLANPKAAVFAVSFLPQFVPSGSSVLVATVVLSLIWVLVDTVWYTALVWSLGRVATFFRRPAVHRAMERVTGVVLLGFGLRMALDSR